MSSLAIANEDCIINFTPVVIPSDAVYNGDIAYTTSGVSYTKSTKIKCKSKYALLDKFTFAWSVSSPCPFSSSSYTFVNGAGNVAATCIKVKCESKLPLRETDTGVCSGMWTLTALPHTPLTCSCTIKISDAGQSKVLAI